MSHARHLGWLHYRIAPIDHDEEPCCWPHCPQPVNDVITEVPLCIGHMLKVAGLVSHEALTRAKTMEPVPPTPVTPASSGPGEIYYLRVDGLIKIGYTVRLAGRIRDYPPHAELLAHHAGTPEYEARLHRKFAPCRARRREWYHPDSDLMEHIAAIVAVSEAAE